MELPSVDAQIKDVIGRGEAVVSQVGILEHVTQLDGLALGEDGPHDVAT